MKRNFLFIAPVIFVFLLIVAMLAITGIALAAEEEFFFPEGSETYHYGWSGEIRNGEMVYNLKAKPGDEYLFVVTMPKEAGEAFIDFAVTPTITATDDPKTVTTVFDNLVEVDGRWTEENDDAKVAFHIKVPLGTPNENYEYHVVTKNADDTVINLCVDSSL